MSEDFAAKLSRWSQRKLAVRRGAAADDEGESTGRGGAPSPQEMPEAQAAEEPVSLRREMATADAGQAPEQETPVLPPVDQLTIDSDYTVFMAKNVPEAVRCAALRKLWLSDPMLANLDRLNDYDEDYNIVETLASAIRTSYQAGKGYLDVENESAERETASERTKRADVSEPRESPAELAGAELAGAASPYAVGDDDAVGDETAAALQPMGEKDMNQAWHRPVEDKG